MILRVMTKNSRLKDFLRLLFPPCCIVCGNALTVNEECLCLSCLCRLPKTNYHLVNENEVEKRFWGKLPIEHASAYFHYVKGSDFDKILFNLKYHGMKEVGEIMGKYMARELSDSGFFHGIDVIIPVPLHKKKQHQRGYNQSDRIACGISAITGIPVDRLAVKRVIANSTQTRKRVWERWEGTRNIFKVILPDNLRGKHILLVDDVMTTGATIVSCADEIGKVEGVKVSVLALAVA